MMADSIDIQQRRRGEEEPIDVVEIQIDRESDDDNEPDGKRLLARSILRGV